MLTFLRQPWHIAGFARQGCCTNWLFGIDGGNQKERHFSSCFFLTCSDGRIRDLWFFNLNGLFLHKSFDVCCLLCSCWFLNKNILLTRLANDSNILRHVCTEGVVSQLPLLRLALGWIVSCQEPERWERIYQKQQQLAAQAKYRHPHKPMGCEIWNTEILQQVSIYTYIYIYIFFLITYM